MSYLYEIELYKWRNGSSGEVDEVFAVKMGRVKKKSSFAVGSWVQILVFTVYCNMILQY